MDANEAVKSLKQEDAASPSSITPEDQAKIDQIDEATIAPDVLKETRAMEAYRNRPAAEKAVSDMREEMVTGELGAKSSIDRYNMNTNANRRAEALKISKELGIPVEVAEREYGPRIQAELQTRAVKQYMEDNEVLRKKLLDPKVAPIFNESAKPLSTTEKFLKGVGHGWQTGINNSEMAMIGYRQLMGKAHPGDDQRLAELSGPQAEDPKDFEIGFMPGPVDEFVTGIPAAVAEMLPLWMTAISGASTEIGVAGAAGAAALGPAGAAGSAALAAKVFTPVEMGKMEAGLAYVEFSGMLDENGQPMDPTVARGAAILVGAINGSLEMFGFERVMSAGYSEAVQGLGKTQVQQAMKIPTVRAALTKLASRLGQAGAAEGFTEALQEVAVIIGGIEAGRIAEGEFEKPNQWQMQNQIMEAAKKGAQAGTGMATPGAGYTATSDILIVKRINKKKKDLGELIEARKQAGAYEQAPDETAEFVEEAAETHGAGESVQVSQEALQTFFQELGLSEEEQVMLLPGTMEDMAAAQLTGREVSVPIAEFMARVVPSTAFKALEPTLRLSPTDMTIEELTSLQKELKELQAMTTEELTEDPVFNTVYEQLIEADYSPETAAPQAQLYSAMFKQMGARTNQDAYQLLQDMDLSIQKEGKDTSVIPGQNKFDQSTEAYHGTWKRDIEKMGGLSTQFINTGEGAQVYGWGLYTADRFGTAKSYYENVTRQRTGKKAGSTGVKTGVNLGYGSNQQVTEETIEYLDSLGEMAFDMDFEDGQGYDADIAENFIEDMLSEFANTGEHQGTYRALQRILFDDAALNQVAAYVQSGLDGENDPGLRQEINLLAARKTAETGNLDTAVEDLMALLDKAAEGPQDPANQNQVKGQMSWPVRRIEAWVLQDGPLSVEALFDTLMNNTNAMLDVVDYITDPTPGTRAIAQGILEEHMPGKKWKPSEVTYAAQRVVDYVGRKASLDKNNFPVPYDQWGKQQMQAQIKAWLEVLQADIEEGLVTFLDGADLHEAIDVADAFKYNPRILRNLGIYIGKNYGSVNMNMQDWAASAEKAADPIRQTIERFNTEAEEESFGQLYELEMKDTETYLDYDKPMSQQSPEVLKRLREAGLIEEDPGIQEAYQSAEDWLGAYQETSYFKDGKIDPQFKTALVNGIGLHPDEFLENLGIEDTENVTPEDLATWKTFDGRDVPEGYVNIGARVYEKGMYMYYLERSDGSRDYMLQLERDEYVDIGGISDATYMEAAEWLWGEIDTEGGKPWMNDPNAEGNTQEQIVDDYIGEGTIAEAIVYGEDGTPEYSDAVKQMAAAEGAGVEEFAEYSDIDMAFNTKVPKAERLYIQYFPAIERAATIRVGNSTGNTVVTTNTPQAGMRTNTSLTPEMKMDLARAHWELDHEGETPPWHVSQNMAQTGEEFYRSLAADEVIDLDLFDAEMKEVQAIIEKYDLPTEVMEDDPRATAKDILRDVDMFVETHDLVLRKDVIKDNEDLQALQRISATPGTDQRSSMILDKAGVPGLQFDDWTRDQSGESTHNYVIWNDAKIDIVKTHFQKAKSGSRGYIQFPEDRSKFTITVTKKKNLSTFLHETGHFYLEMANKMVAEGKANNDLIRDIVTIDAFVGRTPNELYTTEQHEKFARAFEAYLREGKSPSPALKQAFARFKTWLLRVYSNITKLNVDIDDEIRGVFDRMLASEQEIRNAAAAQEFSPIVDANNAMGLTPEQVEGLMKMYTKAMGIAQEEVESAALKSFMRQYTSDYKKRQRQVKAEVEKQLSFQSVYQVQKFLREGEVPNGMDNEAGLARLGGMKLNTAGIKQLFPKGPVLSKLKGMHTENGVHPDIIANFFGYDSGTAMISDILEKPTIKKAAKEITDLQMHKEYGDLAVDGELEGLARKAMHNNAVSNYLFTELEVLGKAIKRKPVPNLKAEMAKVARDHIRSLPMVKVQPHVYYRAEQKAGKDAMEAAASQNFEDAFAARQAQILNHMMFKEATKLQEEFQKHRTKLQWYESVKGQKRYGGMGAEFLDQIRSELSRVGLGMEPNYRAKEELAAFIQRMEELTGQDIYITIPEENAQVNWKALNIEQMEEIRARVEAIAKLARQTAGLEAEAREKRAQELVEAIYEMPQGKIAAARSDAPRTLKDKVVEGIEFAQASLTKYEFLVRMIDDNELGGAWADKLYQPLVDAQNWELQKVDEINTPILEAMRAYDAVKGNRLATKVQFLGVTMTRANLVAIMLNMGNAENRHKMFEGFKLYPERAHWSEAAVIEALQEHLTVEDMKLAQTILDSVNKLWPDVVRVQRALTGYAPPKTAADPVMFEKLGYQFKGGYYPMVYDPDPRINPRQANNQERKDALFSNNFMKPGKEAGAVKARTGYTGGVLLDLGQAPLHVSNMAHYLAFAEPIHELDRLWQHPDVAKAMVDKFGKNHQRGIRPYLADVANPEITVEQATMITKAARYGRTTFSLMALGFKATSAFMQLLGGVMTVNELGLQHTLAGLFRFLRHPIDSWKMVESQSPEFKYLAKTFDREAAAMINDNLKFSENEMLRYGKKVRDASKKHAFLFMQMAQGTVNAITWMAAKEKAMAEGKSGVQAQKYADAVVRQTQSSGQVKDLAAVQRGSELQKLMVPFYTFFSLLYNVIRKELRKARKPGAMPKAELMFRLVLILVVPAFLESILKNKGDQDDDRNRKEKLTSLDWYGFALMESVSYTAAAVPFGGSIVEMFRGNRYGTEVNVAPAASLLQDLYSGPKSVVDALADEEDFDWGDKYNYKWLDILTLLPVSQTVGHLDAIANADDLEDPVYEIISGRRQDRE